MTTFLKGYALCSSQNEAVEEEGDVEGGESVAHVDNSKYICHKFLVI